MEMTNQNPHDTEITATIVVTTDDDSRRLTRTGTYEDIADFTHGCAVGAMLAKPGASLQRAEAFHNSILIADYVIKDGAPVAVGNIVVCMHIDKDAAYGFMFSPKMLGKRIPNVARFTMSRHEDMMTIDNAEVKPGRPLNRGRQTVPRTGRKYFWRFELDSISSDVRM